MARAIVTGADGAPPCLTFSLGDFDCRKTIFQGAGGEQFLLLRHGANAIQVQCKGIDITVDPFVFEPLTGAFPRVGADQKRVRDLADICRCRRTGSDDAGWAPHSLSLRNALIALDGELAGLRHREIATVIYGDQRVAEEWSSPARDMKNRISRAVKRGVNLMRGGYRNLLD